MLLATINFKDGWYTVLRDVTHVEYKTDERGTFVWFYRSEQDPFVLLPSLALDYSIQIAKNK